MTRVLLDEGVPRPLAKVLSRLGIDVTAFPNDWKQLSNGELLTQIERDGSGSSSHATRTCRSNNI